jgi:hypothetical protein
VDDFHWRLASSALEVAARYGFALAGGHAVNAHGFLIRPSADVDLFTSLDEDLAAPTADVVATYRASGLDVRVEHESRYYVRLTVADPESGKESKVELVADIRLMEPVLMAIGPVLHPDDVAAGKVEALFTRAERSRLCSPAPRCAISSTSTPWCAPGTTAANVCWSWPGCAMPASTGACSRTCYAASNASPTSNSPAMTSPPSARSRSAPQ